MRRDDTDDDTYLTTLTKVVRRSAEHFTRHVFVTQTWDFFADRFPARADRFLELPLPPLISVTSIKYTDTDGAVQTWDSSEYVVDTRAERGRILPAWGEVWPSTRQVMNAVEIRFVAGFGDVSDVPEDIKQGMMMFLGHLYEHRESVIIGTIVAQLPQAVQNLLGPYRSVRF